MWLRQSWVAFLHLKKNKTPTTEDFPWAFRCPLESRWRALTLDLSGSACSRLNVKTEGPSFTLQVLVSSFAKLFLRALDQRMPEVEPKDLGNIPHGVPG